MKSIRQLTYHRIPDEDDTEMQKWLLGILNRSEYTLKEVSDILHVSRQTISMWINGRTKINFVEMVAICELFRDYCDFETEHVDYERMWEKINQM